MHDIHYKFTPDEIREKSMLLADCTLKRTQIEDQLKHVKSQFKERIEGETSKINLLASHIQAGFEIRTARCQVFKDFAKGVKEYWFEGVLYDTVKLTAADHQLEIEPKKKEEDGQSNESAHDTTDSPM